MMNRSRIILFFLSAAMLCALSGCRLAREDPETVMETQRDRLAGVLVTTEYLEQRLYATKADKTYTDEKTGQTHETARYIFEGVKGIPYFSIRVPAGEGHESYSTTVTNDGVSDGSTGVNVSDGGTAVSLAGTIHVSPKGMQQVYYVNPVYQSADGQVYVTSGSGISVEGIQDEGTSCSQSFDESYTVTENGKTKTDKISVKLSIRVMNPPYKITMLQMDGNSAVVSRQEYAPGRLPNSISPAPGAEYIVVETYKTNYEGKELVSRILYGKDAKTADTYYCREDGVCVKQITEVKWPE